MSFLNVKITSCFIAPALSLFHLLLLQLSAAQRLRLVSQCVIRRQLVTSPKNLNNHGDAFFTEQKNPEELTRPELELLSLT